jgi:trehalose/maltose hydrolase-like predicted phosphorylase
MKCSLFLLTKNERNIRKQERAILAVTSNGYIGSRGSYM